MDRTRVDGIRSYKRTSDSQRQNVSNILNSNTPNKMSTSTLQYSNLSAINISTTSSVMQNSVPGPGTYNFNSCSSVVLNIQYHRPLNTA